MPDLVSSDLHLSGNPRDAYRLAWLRQLRASVVHFRATRLLLLGDLTEEKDNHNAELVNRIIDELTKITKLCQVILLRGNHDGLSPTTPFFQFVRRIDNMTWVNEPCEIGNDLWLPYTANHERDWSAKLLQRNHRFIFAHNTFEGADLGGGAEARGGIPQEVVPAETRVIAGDVHVPQRTGAITYVGAPYTIDFGDDYDPRILLLEGQIVKTIKQTGPMKRLIDIQFLDDLQGYDYPEGSIVKVRMRLERGEYARWSEMQDHIRQWAASRGFLLHATQPILPKVARRDLPTRIVATASDEKLLRDYGQSKGLDARTLKVGEELL